MIKQVSFYNCRCKIMQKNQEVDNCDNTWKTMRVSYSFLKEKGNILKMDGVDKMGIEKPWRVE